MKNLMLVMGIAAMSGIANGQEATTSMLHGSTDEIAGVPKFSGQKISDSKTGGFSGARTTTTLGRWYDYADTFLNNAYQSGGCHGVPSTASTLITMWNDTTAEFGFSDGTFGNNKWTSVGLVIVPFDAFWNNTVFPCGTLAIRPTDPYTVDSVIAAGIYGRSFANAAKIAVTDQLKFGLVYGNGSSTSDLQTFFFTGMTSKYCLDTVRYLQLFHDSLNNTAANGPGSTTNSEHTYTFNLHAADTSTALLFSKAFALSPVFNVPAGNGVGASVSFKSGDATYPGTGPTPRDTVQLVDGSFKYGAFLPQIVFNGSTGTTTITQFMEYGWPADHTVGHFKRQSASDAAWSGRYIPEWAWTSSSGPSVLQIPRILFHISCSGCTTVCTAALEANNGAKVSGVKMYPNPAVNDFNIEFTLTATSSVSASLSNVMGQTVATQNLGNVSNGKVTFNTSNLPNGVYFYEFIANGSRSTGHVVVAQ